MADTTNISGIKTNKQINLTTLYIETKHSENKMYNDSPFSINTSEYKYLTSVKMYNYAKPDTKFCIHVLRQLS